jgi:hypothetical protein
MCRNDVKEFVRKLDALCQYLDLNFKINEGGCCYIAYEISKYLSKLHIPFSLRVEAHEFKDVQNISLEIKNRTPNNDSWDSIVGHGTCSHYFIWLPGYQLAINSDCSDVTKSIEIPVTSKQLKWIYKQGKWNSTYRLSSNTYVKKYLKLFFNEQFRKRSPFRRHS